MTRTLAALLVVGSLLARSEGAPSRTLTLDQALQAAEERQPALRQARAGSEAASARARESLAPMLPQLNLGLGYKRSTNNSTPQPGVPSFSSSDGGVSTLSLNSYDFWTGNLTLSGTLWDFGRSLGRLNASQAAADAAASGVISAQAAARLLVRQAFLTAAGQRELVDVAQATYANTELHFKQVEGFVRVGTRPDIDLAQSRSERANARLQLVQATAAYQVARARLNQAMGVEGPTDYQVQPPVPAPIEGETAAVEALLPEAAAARPDVAQFVALVRAQELTLRSVRGNFWPILAASLGLTVGARDLSQPVPNASVGVTLNWPLYEGGLTVAQVSENEALLRQLQAQADALRLQVRLDVEQALTQVTSSVEAVSVSGEAEAAARERLRLAEGRYQAGAGSSIELGDAQVAYTTAAAQRVQAVYTLATARAQLLAALGRP